MVRYGGRKVHTSGKIVKEIATWDGGDKSNWGPMFVQYLRVNSYGPLECHLIQISNRGRQIIFIHYKGVPLLLFGVRNEIFIRIQMQFSTLY